MQHLYRGGRISKTKMYAETLLNIKPIIGFLDDGRLDVVTVAKGNKNAIKKLLERVKGNIKEDTLVSIVYGQETEEAKILKEELKKLGASNIYLKQIGCSVGVHTGPDILGIVYVED